MTNIKLETVILLAQGVEDFVDHHVSITLHSDSSGEVYNYESDTYEVLFAFENLRQLVEYLLYAGTPKN